MDKLRISSPRDVVALAVQLTGYRPHNSVCFILLRDTVGGAEVLAGMRLDCATKMPVQAIEYYVLEYLRYSNAVGATTVMPVIFHSSLSPFQDVCDSSSTNATPTLNPVPTTDTVNFTLDVEPFVLAVCEELMHTHTVSAPVWAAQDLCGYVGEAEYEYVSDSLQQGNGHRGGLAAHLALPEPQPALVAGVHALRPNPGPVSELIATFISEVQLGLKALSQRNRNHLTDAHWLHVSPQAVCGCELVLTNVTYRDAFALLLSGTHERWTCERIEADEFCDLAPRIVADPSAFNHWPGLGTAQPSHRRSEAIAQLLRVLSVHVDTDCTGPVLALLAWCEWARARMSWAEHYAQAALSFAPSYTLAHVVIHMVNAGMPPAWARTLENSTS